MRLAEIFTNAQPNDNEIAFVAEMKSISQKNPMLGDDDARVIVYDQAGRELVLFNFYFYADGVVLDSLKAMPGKKGLGARFMEQMCGIADKHKVTLKLSAEPKGYGPERISVNKLKQFYKRFGFKVTTQKPGTNGYCIMIRKPI